MSIAPFTPMFGVMLCHGARPKTIRERLRRIVAVCAIAACPVLLGSWSAAAHPIGNFTINLYSGIHILPGQVRIDYVLEMAEISTQEQKPGMDLNEDGVISPAEMDGWGQRASAQILTNLTMEVNGQPVELALVDSRMRFRPGQGGLDLIYMQATVEGTLPDSGEVHYTDANYTTRPGWREITAVADPGSAIIASDVPDESISDALQAYPPAMFQQPLEVTEATLSFQPSDAPVESAAPGGAAGDAHVSPPPTGSSSPAGSGGFADLLATSSGRAAGLLLLLAFGFGFIHALGPGHGKTIMAASTLSGSVRLRHAVALGGLVAAMHCATVIALGAIAYAASQTISSERVFSDLKLVTALVVAIVGGVMLIVRIRERHAHDHEHQHGHPHKLSSVRPKTSGMDRASIAAVAASGGLIPSPSAVVVLLGAIAVDRIPMGIALVVTFSLGLATSLILVGTASHFARTRLGRTENRLMGWLPIAAAAAIFAVGLFLTVQVVSSHPFRS